MIIPPADRLKIVKEYYFSKKLQEIRDLRAKGMDIINLGIGSPDLPPSEETIEALIESARNPSNHGYQHYKGIESLRKAICDYQRKIYKINLDPDSENMIMSLLKKINEEYETTMIVVTHRDSVAKYGNKIVKMDKGAIISVK